jgi:hypothetical protein
MFVYFLCSFLGIDLTEHQYLFSRFLGVAILQLLIIYRIYDYDMLTLSQ